MKLLVINPGSTSTKISVYEDENSLFEVSIFHDAPELMRFPTVNDQVPMRKQVILDALSEHGMEPKDIDVFIGRGGSAHTQPSGVTVIDARLYWDTSDGVGGSDHPAKLGVMIAYELGRTYGKPMFTLNPTNVDELDDIARVTGLKGVYRNAQAHVLNQKATAQLHARKLGRPYEELDLIVCHIDGGITVNAHRGGRMVDGNVGAGGEGAFTPTRVGSTPVLPLLDFIESHSVAEVRRMCSRAGGFASHFGTSDADIVHRMAESGDTRARRVWDAMIYQVCKDIGAMATVLRGHVDGILLTGGLVRFDDIVDGIRDRCGWIGPISVYPGEMEQDAMALSVLRVLRGEDTARVYSGRDVWNGFADEKPNDAQ